MCPWLVRRQSIKVLNFVLAPSLSLLPYCPSAAAPSGAPRSCWPALGVVASTVCQAWWRAYYTQSWNDYNYFHCRADTDFIQTLASFSSANGCSVWSGACRSSVMSEMVHFLAITSKLLQCTCVQLCPGLWSVHQARSCWPSTLPGDFVVLGRCSSVAVVYSAHHN